MEELTENRVLSRLKEGDEATVERAYAILDNSRALKVLSVWGLGVCLGAQGSSEGAEPADLDELWAHAWRLCEVDFEKIASMRTSRHCGHSR